MHALDSDPTVGSLMSSPIQTLAPETTAMDALELAERAGVHHFPVLDGDRLLGLVCTCDLEDVELTAPIRTAIRRAPVSLDEHAHSGDALSKMRSELVGSVLVTRDGRAVGIVTREDLCKAGLDAADAPNFHCDSCGAVTHLKREGTKGVLCLDCRSHSNPESMLDETGVVD
jgi:CBS domain-containing protein